jgi:hypothetical protein
MQQRAPDLHRSIRIIRRHAGLVSIAIAAGVLAGAVCVAFSPRMFTSTAFVNLPKPDVASAVVVARSDPVLAGALLRGSPAASLEALRGEVQVKTLAGDTLSVSASARTAAQAEVTANTVADSYIGYISSPGSPAVRVQAQLLVPATTATRPVLAVRLLVGAGLGLVSGLLIGAMGALGSRRPSS